MKNLSTTSLFYNKFLFKLRIKNSVGSIFRHANLRWAKSKLDEMQQAAEADMPIRSPFFHGLRETVKPVSLETFMDACIIYKAIERNRHDCMLRCEGHTVDIYSNTIEWLVDLSKQVNATEFWQPEDDIVDILLDNTNTVVIDKPQKYPYKVYFSNFATPGFAEYCDKNDNIKIGKIALESVRRGGYLNGFYFWVTTEKQLMLAKIALGNGISKIIKHVTKDELHK